MSDTASPPPVPDLIRRYFELAPSADTDAYFALFADDAVVEDEGHEHHGIDAIRSWRREIPPVRYDINDVADITDIEAAGAGVAVTCTITGDFPGSPFAGLKFRFEQFDHQHIRVLRIRP